mmetsp:Transcript_148524/g.377827  ORF Transcript_148524/g.377827 Transcript_148524/m.377827 type:complete len:318 (+) Transcript_148524:118-1071(+)
MEEFLGRVRDELPGDEAMECYSTLTLVFGNILRNPTELKYRTLKKANKIVSGKLGKSNAALALLLAAGFEENSEAYVFPEDASFQQMDVAMEALQAALLASAPLTEVPPSTTTPPVVEPMQTPLPPLRSRRAAGEAKEKAASSLDEIRKQQAAKYRDHEFDRALGEGYCSANSQLPPSGSLSRPTGERAPKPVSRRAAGEAREKAASSLDEMRKQQAAKYRDYEFDRAFGEDRGSASSQLPPSGSLSLPTGERDAKPAEEDEGASGGVGKDTSGWTEWLPGWLGGAQPTRAESGDVQGAGAEARLTPHAGDVRTIRF